MIRLCSWFVADLALCAALPLTTEAVGCMQLAFVLERPFRAGRWAALPLANTPAWPTPLPRRRPGAGPDWS